jgi:hypothetical protein
VLSLSSAIPTPVRSRLVGIGSFMCVCVCVCVVHPPVSAHVLTCAGSDLNLHLCDASQS